MYCSLQFVFIFVMHSFIVLAFVPYFVQCKVVRFDCVISSIIVHTCVQLTCRVQKTVCVATDLIATLTVAVIVAMRLVILLSHLAWLLFCNVIMKHQLIR